MALSTHINRDFKVKQLSLLRRAAGRRKGVRIVSDMVRYARIIVLSCAVLGFAWADDLVKLSEEEQERRWNTPPELTPDWPVKQIAAEKTDGVPKARFLPFTASFSLNAGQNNAHTLSVGADREGFSLSQSSSIAQSNAASFGNTGSLAASQSSSFSAGLGGISSADSNSFSLNHPIFGGSSQADSNTFSIGQANAASHGNAGNGQASSGAQTSVGSSQSSASSGSSLNGNNHQQQGHRKGRPVWSNIHPNYAPNDYLDTRRPMLVITHMPTDWNQEKPARGPIRLDISTENTNWNNQRPHIHISKWNPSNGPHPDDLETWDSNDCRALRNCGQNHNGHSIDSTWSQGHRFPPGIDQQVHPVSNQWPQGQVHSQPSWIQSQDQGHWQGGLGINTASASSSSSSGPGGFSVGQSTSQSGSGSRGPTSSTINHVHTSGNAQGHAQGAAASVDQSSGGPAHGSFSSGAISGISSGNGQSLGTSISGNRGGNSKGQVNTHTIGTASVQGTANSGAVSDFRFPDDTSSYDVPREFVRNGQMPQSRKIQDESPIESIISDIEDSVADLFDFE